MITPKTLQQRLSLYLLLPVALLLIVMGFAGYIYARNILLSQWREASVLKLQRAAHQVDMRLMRACPWTYTSLRITGSTAIPDMVLPSIMPSRGRAKRA